MYRQCIGSKHVEYTVYSIVGSKYIEYVGAIHAYMHIYIDTHTYVYVFIISKRYLGSGCGCLLPMVWGMRGSMQLISHRLVGLR